MIPFGTILFIVGPEIGIRGMVAGLQEFLV